MIIKEYVELRKVEIKCKISELQNPPHLVIIQINDDEASKAYVRGKLKDLAFVGAKCTHLLLSLDTTEEELMNLIDKYNEDYSVDAVLVQMPLPKHIDEEKVKNRIIPSKDIDGFNPLSIYNPCTPQGIINYLKHEKYEFTSKNAVVIGRSNIVGKPMAHLLLKENMNVTVLHSRTKQYDLENYLRNADLVVVAVGKKHLITFNEFKENAYLFDVGINRVDGHLYGDIDPNVKAEFVSPVPGGVGLLTRLCLLENLLLCYDNNHAKK